MLPRLLGPTVPVVAAGLVIAAVTVLATRDSRAAEVAAPVSAPAAGAATTAGAAGPGASALAARSSTARASERRAALTATLTDLAATTDFSVALADHATGAFYAFGADQEFETASIVKVEILAALLLRLRASGGELTANQRALADTMIRESDNAAAAALWWQIGDVDGLSAANTALGLTDTDPGDGGWWSLTTTTAVDQVTMLDAIADPGGPLGPANATGLALMGSVVADQSWGVSAAADPGEVTVLKNGWMPRSNQDGRWTVNSIGRVTGGDTDFTIAVLSRGHASLDRGIAFVEKVARLARAQIA